LASGLVELHLIAVEVSDPAKMAVEEQQ